MTSGAPPHDGTEPHALELTSPTIGVSRAPAVRRWGRRGFVASSVVSLLSLGVAIPATSASLGVIAFVAFVAAVACALGVAASGLATGTRRAGFVTVASGVLTARFGTSTWRRPLGDVANGWVEAPHRVRLQMKDGTVLDVVAPDEATADALLRAAGASVSQRVLDVALTSAASRTFLGVATGVVGVVVLGMVLLLLVWTLGLGLVESFRALKDGALLGMGILVAMIALFGWAFAGVLGFLLGRRVTVGVDGLTVRGLLSRTFTPLSSITGVAPHAQGVRVSTRRGDVLLPTWRRGEAPLVGDGEPTSDGARRQRTLLDRIRGAAALLRPGGPELAMLDRAGRPLATWREDLRALTRGPSDYRRVQLPAQDLEAIVTDATAPAERRIAAVMALSSSEEPSAKVRIRVAIDTCADDDLRAALERAAEDELDDEVLRRAIRAV